MRELKGNIWDYKSPDLIVIPTNLEVNSAGNAIMGAGLAKQAVNYCAELPEIYGNMLQDGRFLPTYLNGLNGYNFCLLPTKRKWRENSSVDLIEEGLNSLLIWSEHYSQVILPKLGCGKGNLDYKSQVKPLLLKYFENNDKIIVLV